MDYRAARNAKEAFNHPDRKQGFKVLEQNPGLLEVLAKMARAQVGADLHPENRRDEGLAVAEANRSVNEEA